MIAGQFAFTRQSNGTITAYKNGIESFSGAVPANNVFAMVLMVLLIGLTGGLLVRRKQVRINLIAQKISSLTQSKEIIIASLKNVQTELLLRGIGSIKQSGTIAIQRGKVDFKP
jgi:hypothetical protein